MTEKWERWNKEEMAILKKHYPDMPRDDLMQLLPGRTWRSIGHQAEKQEIRRNGYIIPKSAKQAAALHAKLSTARSNRTEQPFAGKHHTADAKLAISASNLHARGHSIADIAVRNRIAEKEVARHHSICTLCLLLTARW